MSKLIYITDRSAVETDDTCGMKFWLNRKEAGIGIVPVKEVLPLAIGRETHEDLLAVANMQDISPDAIQGAIDTILAPISEDDKIDQRMMELVYRRVGWLAAFALFMEPDIRAEFDTVQVEHELILDRTPLWVATTPDRILRRRSTGELIYKEYKTTISAAQKWINSWAFAIQLHIGIAAAQEEIEQKVAFGQVMGLMKGYESMADHRLMHPYVWAWYNEGTGQWTNEYEKARSAGWKPMPVWEYPGGVVAWVQFCGAEVARSQFPHSMPVFLNERMLDEWVARRLFRERIIRSVEEKCRESVGLRSLYFERRTKNCRPPFGDACQYALACWNAEVAADPLASSEYVVRVPHHDVERATLGTPELQPEQVVNVEVEDAIGPE